MYTDVLCNIKTGILKTFFDNLKLWSLFTHLHVVLNVYAGYQNVLWFLPNNNNS